MFLGRETNLVLCCCAPVRYALGICDAFLEAVGSEGAEEDAGGAVYAAHGPERGGHGDLFSCGLI